MPPLVGRLARRRNRRSRDSEDGDRAEAAQLSNLTIRQRLSHELDARKDQIPAILDALSILDALY